VCDHCELPEISLGYGAYFLFFSITSEGKPKVSQGDPSVTKIQQIEKIASASSNQYPYFQGEHAGQESIKYAQ